MILSSCKIKWCLQKYHVMGYILYLAFIENRWYWWNCWPTLFKLSFHIKSEYYCFSVSSKALIIYSGILDYLNVSALQTENLFTSINALAKYPFLNDSKNDRWTSADVFSTKFLLLHWWNFIHKLRINLSFFKFYFNWKTCHDIAEILLMLTAKLLPGKWLLIHFIIPYVKMYQTRNLQHVTDS